jgi:hypothetical protein
MKVILRNPGQAVIHQILEIPIETVQDISIIIHNGRFYVMRCFNKGYLYFEETDMPYVATERDYAKDDVK